MTRILHEELRELTSNGLTAHELGTMGANFMDARRRPLLLEAWAA